jgi:small-conductance mechanosensitive channel
MTYLGLTIEEWLQAGVSLLVFLVAAVAGRRLIGLLVDNLFRRLAGRTATDVDEAVLEAVEPPLYWLLVTAVAGWAINRLELLSPRWEAQLEEVFFVLYLLIAFLALWRLVSKLSEWYVQEIAPHTESDLDEQLIPFLRRVAGILIVFILLITLLSHFEVNVSALVTTLGIGSLAIALAAQAALADTVSGFVIMMDRPFRIGDRIEVLDLDTWGDVVDIGLRSSRIRTRDNRMVIIPNSVIGKSLIVNHSYPDTQYRIQIHIGVAYGTDIEFARQVMIDAVQGVEGVLPDRPVEALFLEFADSAMIFRVRWWLESYEDTRRMFDRVNTALYKALEGAGIEIPFPQRDLRHRLEGPTLPDLLKAVRGG